MIRTFSERDEINQTRCVQHQDIHSREVPNRPEKFQKSL